MSTPVRKRHDVPPQDGPSDDGPSKYAPKRTRLPKADPDKELAGVNAAPMSESTESPDPPWRRKDQPGAFVDDLDIGEMRNRIGRVERVAEPPVPDSSGWMPTAARRLALIVGTAAGVAAVVIGYRWDTVPSNDRNLQAPMTISLMRNSPRRALGPGLPCHRRQRRRSAGRIRPGPRRRPHRHPHRNNSMRPKSPSWSSAAGSSWRMGISEPHV